MTMTPLSPALPSLATPSSFQLLGRWLGDMLSATSAVTGGRAAARASSAERSSERRSAHVDAALDRQRVLRAAEKGRAIELGSVARPYSPVTLSALEPLEQYEGLEVHLVVGPGTLDRHVAELAALDRRHALALDVVCPIEDSRLRPHEADAALETLRLFAQYGLTTRLLLAPRCRVLQSDALPNRLSGLLRKAREAGACDVHWGGPRRTGIRRIGHRHPWTSELELQRLRHGFPRL